MKIDCSISLAISGTAAMTRAAEAAGYDGAWTLEASHDPFLPCVVAAEHSERLEIGTSIAVAFARNPMTMAHTARDLQSFSKGRFLLGVGSQVKPHIERRFSMPWSQPAARMHEYIAAMRAIWDAWENGTRLDFRGDFYTHTLMTPFFDPGPTGFGAPAVYLAGVSERMTEVAGEAGDGFIGHGFTTERYVREVTRPALERGRARAGKTLDGFNIALPGFVVTGSTAEEMDAAADRARQRIAFYGSTPAYRGVLELHGWSALHDDLHVLSRQGRWVEMGKLIDDEILRAFAVVAEPEQLAGELLRRYRGIVTRLSLSTPHQFDAARWQPVLEELRAGLGGEAV
jgi:probable F420-dependent oxidoreductase